MSLGLYDFIIVSSNSCYQYEKFDCEKPAFGNSCSDICVMFTVHIHFSYRKKYYKKSRLLVVKKLSYSFQLPTMVSIETLCTPLSNKSIHFRKNHSCLTTLDQPSNHQLPLPSPDVSAQLCQSVSTPALVSPNSRKCKSRIAN